MARPPEAHRSLLRVERLVKRYRRRTVVRDVSLEVRGGEVVGLLGPNGAGKTTSFHMIVGLVPADGGSIRLDHHDLSRLAVHERARLGIGYLPQENSVFRGLTVEENILAVLELASGLTPAVRQRRLEGLLREFHLLHIRDNLGSSLSGGERRRVEIARTLALAPRFVLLDEPFAGVDPISVLDIRRIVGRLCELGIGVLLTDHNVREALGSCHRAYIVNEGRVIAAGEPEAILADEQVRQVYLGAEFAL